MSSSQYTAYKQRAGGDDQMASSPPPCHTLGASLKVRRNVSPPSPPPPPYTKECEEEDAVRAAATAAMLLLRGDLSVREKNKLERIYRGITKNAVDERRLPAFYFLNNPAYNVLIVQALRLNHTWCGVVIFHNAFRAWDCALKTWRQTQKPRDDVLPLDAIGKFSSGEIFLIMHGKSLAFNTRDFEGAIECTPDLLADGLYWHAEALLKLANK